MNMKHANLVRAGLALAMACGLCSFARSASGEVRLPKVFSSHMVLQRDMKIAVWGWANPGEKVTLELADQKAEATANAKGEWKTFLSPMKAGGPYTLSVSGSNTVKFDDVLLGEVWLCSGQSNMEMGIGAAQNGKEEIAAANYPEIRLLMVPNLWKPEPQNDMAGTWAVCTPQTVAEGGWGGFTAAGYFFGRELHKKLGVPVGLIDATWGGTRIESWTPPEGFAAVDGLKRDHELLQIANPHSKSHRERLEKVLRDTEAWVGSARQALAAETNVPPMPAYPAELLPPHELQNPTALYNGMIYPIHPFTLRGAIWYQGESNNGEGMLYADRMKALIQGWRQIWGEGDFPFYYVQVAPFTYGTKPEVVAELWEAQTAAQSVPNSGMVVINDIGNLKDIHPVNKQEVGRRLALWALAKTYGEKDLVHAGPTFEKMQVEGDKVRVTFTNVGGGLTSRDGKPLSWFEIIDADDGGFVKADAVIDGQTVVLSSPSVTHPVAMRFAWSMLAEPNLMNAEGLPAGPFRSGKVPRRDALSRVPEAKEYQLVYDLDLSKLGANIQYTADSHKNITRPFDRVAYCLELQDGGGNWDYVYVSMDAFTSDAGKIGIPTAASGASFQQNVANLTVYSNAKGIVTGTALAGGNIEFWPNNYGMANAANVPNASSQAYDFGDEPSGVVDGYGSMQVHNHDAKQTLFALNHWRDGAKADVGIGNQASGSPDWTFAGNADGYSVKRLRVLVRLK
jgi:sialate O-acetylesterase